MICSSCFAVKLIKNTCSDSEDCDVTCKGKKFGSLYQTSLKITHKEVKYSKYLAVIFVIY